MPEPPPARRGARGRAPRDHTPERVLAAAGVLALLVVFAVIVSLIANAVRGDGSSEQQASVAAQPTVTPTPKPTRTPKPKPTPKPLTAGELTERRAAEQVVQSRGFDVVRRHDWDPKD